MEYEYQTFILVTSKDGILLVSKRTTSDLFILICNRRMGFVVQHDYETNYLVRGHVDYNSLDLQKAVTYYATNNDSSFWVVAIPFYGVSDFDPMNFYKFSSLSVHYEMKGKIPNNFLDYLSLAIYTGVPE